VIVGGFLGTDEETGSQEDNSNDLQIKLELSEHITSVLDPKFRQELNKRLSSIPCRFERSSDLSNKSNSPILHGLR